MGKTVKVRLMADEDWKQLHKMDLEIFPDDVLDEEWFKKRVQKDGCFVLDLEGCISGYLVVARYGMDEGHLGRIGVAKMSQGKGYGSVLMQYALDWFRNQEGIRSVHLYTQDFNSVAQELYKKFGFRRSGTTWHFFVPYKTLKPTREYTCQGIEEDEIESAGRRFPSLPAEQIKRFLTHEEFRVLTLKDRNGSIVGVCRFTPSFPGCMPFEIADTSYFDDFAAGVRRFGLPEYDYVRITFTNMPELARLCEKRGYHLHHRLYKMTLIL
jgi:GNAT superfamily N-acetyltransferase